MEGEDSLVLEGVALFASEAVLEWREAGFAWTAGAAFVANGTMGPEIDPGGAGLELRADLRNHLKDGAFNTADAWSFDDASSGQTVASWDASRREARIEHLTPASPALQWDSLDSEANWFGVGFQGTCALATVSSGQIEGTGMMQATIRTGPSAAAWAGPMRMGPFNWSAYDRLLAWVQAPAVPTNVTFNVSALIGTSLRGTTPDALSAGWQEIVVDLTELGPDRREITQVTLRFNGASLDDQRFYLDGIRLVGAKQIDERAGARQPVVKANATGNGVGTAVLSYDLYVENATGVSKVESFLNVTGPTGSFERSTRSSTVAVWLREAVDVSAWLAAAGSYDVRVGIRFEIETTGPSNGTVRLDNVTLHFPGRENGTFISQAVDLGARSLLLRWGWEGVTGNGTSLRVATRLGNSPAPGDATWGAWSERSSPGNVSFVIEVTARYIQIRAVLETTDASRTPQLSLVRLDARHRSLAGTVTTAPYTVSGGFAGWSRFDAGWNATSQVSVDFAVLGGSGSSAIAPGSDLRGLSLGPTVQVMATLATTDGLATPRLTWLRLAYEVPGGAGAILTNPTFLALAALGAVAYVAYTILSRRMYSVEDLFLVARDGRLILHNTNRLHADRDEDLFAGMLTAMSSFVKDTFKEERGGLRQFAVGGKQVLIERVDSVFLAAIYSNRVPRWAPKHLRALAEDLQDQFGDRLRQWSGSSEDLQDLRALTDRFLRKTRYRRRPFPGRAA